MHGTSSRAVMHGTSSCAVMHGTSSCAVMHGTSSRAVMHGTMPLRITHACSGRQTSSHHDLLILCRHVRRAGNLCAGRWQKGAARWWSHKAS
eukprot:366011-Chlamydomonas_euryale.AAC.4